MHKIGKVLLAFIGIHLIMWLFWFAALMVMMSFEGSDLTEYMNSGRATMNLRINIILVLGFIASAYVLIRFAAYFVTIFPKNRQLMVGILFFAFYFAISALEYGVGISSDFFLLTPNALAHLHFFKDYPTYVYLYHLAAPLFTFLIILCRKKRN